MSNLNLRGVDSWGAANRFLGEDDEKTLAYATKLRRSPCGEWIEVVHHRTAIIRYHCDEYQVYLRNGGYVSRTTSDRLHQMTPASVGVSFAKGGSVHSPMYEGPQPHDWARVH